MLPFCYLFANKYELYLTSFQTFFFWNGWKFAITKRGYINIYFKAFFGYRLPLVTKLVLNYYLSWNRISVMSFFSGLFLFATELVTLVTNPLRGFILYFGKNIRKRQYFSTYTYLLSNFIVNKKSKILTNVSSLRAFKTFIILGSAFRLFFSILWYTKYQNS